MEKLKYTFENLIDRNDTRWNSTYYMVDRLCDARAAVLQAQNSLATPGAAAVELLESEFDHLKGMRDVLRPFENATKVLEYNDRHCGGLLYQVFEGLMGKCNPSSCDPEPVAALKLSLRALTSTKWNEIVGTNRLNAVLLLDPRTKSLGFISDKKKRLEVEVSARNQLREILLVPDSSDPEAEPPAKKRAIGPTDPFSIMLADLLPATATRIDTTPRTSPTLAEQLQRELALYSAEPLASPFECPLEWWDRMSERYPLLAKGARLAFSAPSAAVECERIFSEAGLLTGSIRSAMSGDTADDILFVRRNMERVTVG
jgi:hypothetical protein